MILSRAQKNPSLSARRWRRLLYFLQGWGKSALHFFEITLCMCKWTKFLFFWESHAWSRKKGGWKVCNARFTFTLWFSKKSSNSEIRLAEVKSVKCNSDVITRKPKTKKWVKSEICEKCVKSEKSETCRVAHKKSPWNGKVHFSLTPDIDIKREK